MSVPPLANTFEGGVDTTAITAANSGGLSGNPFDVVTGAPTYSAEHHSHGTLGMKIHDAASQATVRWSAFGSLQTDVYQRFYLYLAAIPTTNVLRAFAFTDSGGLNGATIEITTAG